MIIKKEHLLKFNTNSSLIILICISNNEYDGILYVSLLHDGVIFKMHLNPFFIQQELSTFPYVLRISLSCHIAFCMGVCFRGPKYLLAIMMIPWY